MILLTNATIENATVAGDISILAFSAALLLASGVLLFKLSLKKAKKDGNLTRWA